MTPLPTIDGGDAMVRQNGLVERQLILGPRREHSRKPDDIYDRIKRLLPGPYLELFARTSGRPGWTAWGDQKERFTAHNEAYDACSLPA